MSSYGHTSESVLLTGTSQVIGASATDTAVSKVFRLSDLDSLFLVLDITTSGRSGTITAKLQTSHDASTWFDSKTATVSANATTIKLLAHDTATDAAFLPLRPLARVVITTAAASGVTVSEITRTVRA